MNKARQVVIGNSAAALHAIQSIRQADPFCSITLISTEKCHAYSPVLLPYYIKGARTKQSLFIVDREFYNVSRIKALWGSQAVGIDPLRQNVLLENGRKVGYDNLLIATGASAINLPGSEESGDRVFSLRKIEDADRILEKIKSAKTVTVVGAGLIGAQVIDALLRGGAQFTLVECADQVLPEVIDPMAAGIIQKEMESQRITVLLGNKVRELRKGRKKVSVILESGKGFSTDMVIVGIGQKPNIQFLENTGIKTNVGILVDERMRTNVNNIFAAGDVAEGKNLLTGGNEVLPNWPNACSQGRVAGRNMIGQEQRYEGLHEAVTTILGLTAASIGRVKGPQDKGYEELRFCSGGGKIYRKILLAEEKIVGALLLGKAEDAGILKNLIRNQIDISSWKEEFARFPLDAKKWLLSKTTH